LYLDKVNVIPFDKLEKFFKENFNKEVPAKAAVAELEVTK